MSFLRQTLFRQARQFSTTPTARKSMLDSVKETADAVNKKIGQAAAEGIQKGRTSRPVPQISLEQELTML